MKNIISLAIAAVVVVTAVFGIFGLLNKLVSPTVHAATGTSSDNEIVKALNIQNQQLARIAASLERISGQQPGWKLPN